MIRSGVRPLTLSEICFTVARSVAVKPPTVHAYKTLHVFAFYRLFSLHVHVVDAMQAPRFMRKKSSRELYNTCTCGLGEALEDFA